MSTEEKAARLPPRWFVRTAWAFHRTLYKVTGGRVGLRKARPDKWGMLRLTVTGRRSGEPRSVILGYLQDGPNMVTLAMNGWAPPEPAWWLNLQATSEAMAEVDGSRVAVRGRAAHGAERERLWNLWRGEDSSLDEYAARRPRETAVVVLEPQ